MTQATERYELPREYALTERHSPRPAAIAIVASVFTAVVSMIFAARNVSVWIDPRHFANGVASWQFNPEVYVDVSRRLVEGNQALASAAILLGISGACTGAAVFLHRRSLR
jgi:hypothetical protein